MDSRLHAGLGYETRAQASVPKGGQPRKEFLVDVRKYQYQEQKQYDELWRNTIWSDNGRERAVLDILLGDERMCDSSLRYSDVARYELARLNAPKSH